MTPSASTSVTLPHSPAWLGSSLCLGSGDMMRTSPTDVRLDVVAGAAPPWSPGSCARRRSTTRAIGSGPDFGVGLGMQLHALVREGNCGNVTRAAFVIPAAGRSKWLADQSCGTLQCRDKRWPVKYAMECKEERPGLRGVHRTDPSSLPLLRIQGRQQTYGGYGPAVSLAEPSTFRPCRRPEVLPVPACLPSSPPPRTRW